MKTDREGLRDYTGNTNQSYDDLESKYRRFESIVKSTNVAPFELNIQTGEAVFSERWIEIIGYTLSELAPLTLDTWKRLTHPDDLKIGMMRLEQHFNRQSDYYEFEYRMKHKDGHWVWVYDRGRVASWTDDLKPLMMYGIHKDINVNKLTERALEESESNFRLFIESMSDIMLVATVDGNIIYANKVTTQKLGYSTDELYSMHILDLHPIGCHKEAEDILASMFRKERDTCPLPLITKDGVLVPVETKAWCGQWNGVDCIYGICKDLSPLVEAQQRFERLFHNNPAPMVLSTLFDHRFYDVNSAFLATTGYSRSEVIGKSSLEMGMFTQIEEHQKQLKRLEIDGAISDIELQIRCKDGRVLTGLFSGELIYNQGKQYLITVMIDITERKQAETELKISQSRFQDIIDNTAAAIYVKSPEGKFIIVNQALADLTGITKDELIGRTSFDLWSNEIAAQHTANDIKVLATGCLLENEEIVTDPSGQRIFISQKFALRDNESNIYGVAGVSTEITSRKKVEETLKGSEHNLQTLLDTVTEGIALNEIVYDENGDMVDYRILSVNRAFYDIADYTDDQLIGNVATKVYGMSPEMIRSFWEKHRYATATSYSEMSSPLRQKCFFVATSPFADNKFVTTFVDITEQKRTERELPWQTNLLQAIADMSPFAIIVVDIRTNEILYSNHHFYELFGMCDIEQEIAQGTMNKADVWSRYLSLIENSGNSESNDFWQNPSEVEVTDCVIKLLDGRTIRRLSTIVGSSSDFHFGRLTIFEDITQRIAMQEGLALAKEVAEATTQAEADFLTNMSHEMRTPLNAIIGLSGLLLNSELTHEQLDFIQSIRASSDALLFLVNDLVDLAAIGSGKLVFNQNSFSLQKLVDDIVRIHTTVAEKKGLLLAANVASDIEDNLVGDAGRIRQILVNLVENAIKFTDSGHIVITVRAISMTMNSLELRFDVSDTGRGISPEEQVGVFHKFVRVGSDMGNGHGIGLGLTISAQLVEMMGGRIWVESETNRGSRFSFTLPMGIQPRNIDIVPDAHSELPYPSKLSIDRSLRILVAEDNDINKKVIVHMLSHYGQNIVLASNGEEALALWKSGDFDLILMDIMMPDMDGYTVTAAIREYEKSTGQHIPIIAMTARALKGDDAKCLEAGMDAYLAKPIMEEELVITIVNVTSLPTVAHSAKRTNKNNGKRRKLPVFDMVATLEDYGGDKEFVMSLLSDIVKDCDLQIAEMHRTYESGSNHQLRYVAHTLSGLFALVTAPYARLAAQKLEQAVIINRPATVALALARLKKEAKILRDALQEFIDET